MKTLEASILTFNLDRVRQELHTLGVSVVAYSEAPGVRRSAAPGQAVATAAFLPRIQVRVVAPAPIVNRVEQILRDAS